MADSSPATGIMVQTPPGTTVRGLSDLHGIPAEEVRLIMVNGHSGEKVTSFEGDECVGLFPPVGEDNTGRHRVKTDFSREKGSPRLLLFLDFLL